MTPPPDSHEANEARLDRLITVADRTVRHCLRKLPPEIRPLAAELPVSYEARPHPGLDMEDLESDLLGLFVGCALDEDAGMDSAPVPAQVLLFLENIWDYAGHNERDFKQEVLQTYLHELGHYLSLDEDDLAIRGLD